MIGAKNSLHVVIGDRWNICILPWAVYIPIRVTERSGIRYHTQSPRKWVSFANSQSAVPAYTPAAPRALIAPLRVSNQYRHPFQDYLMLLSIDPMYLGRRLALYCAFIIFLEYVYLFHDLPKLPTPKVLLSKGSPCMRPRPGS